MAQNSVPPRGSWRPEALESHQKALHILIGVLGHEHPDVATSHNNIGATLRDLGRYEEAGAPPPSPQPTMHPVGARLGARSREKGAR